MRKFDAGRAGRLAAAVAAGAAVLLAGLWLGGGPLRGGATVYSGVDLFSAGQPLLPLPGSYAARPMKARLNGNEMTMVRCASDLPPARVAEAYCAAARGRSVLEPEYDRLGGAGIAKVLARGLPEPYASILEGKEPGYLYTSRTLGFFGFIDRDERFCQVLAYANPGTGGSDYFLQWAEDYRLNMEPLPSGDMPGEDCPYIGRPPLSRRTLSLIQDGGEFGLWVYETDSSVSSVVAHVLAEAERNGWERKEKEERALEEVASCSTLWFGKRSAQLFVDVERQEGVTRAVIVSVGKP